MSKEIMIRTKISKEVLKKCLDGTDRMCACGNPLIPTFDSEGKRSGVTHETDKQEEHHYAFWSGLKVEIVK